MGVYISGLEIPPKGKGAVVILCSSGSVYSGGQKVGTAAPVPPHGDLIDRDALRDTNCDVFEINGADGTILAMDISIIDSAPTIIPAEEGE